jgi:hydrogenase maturation protein HypF
MSTIRGARIHVNGIVQGVGFRPFVFNLARRLGVTGWVRNTSGGVDIELDGASDSLRSLVAAIHDEAPPLSRIDDLKVEYQPAHGFVGFEIRDSESLPEAFQPISPDVAVCADCLREMNDPQDRRFRYPFINCTNCGPRFTIIKDIPYDRPSTTMAPFPMCPDCASEYEDPSDRRFHAQPVACAVCGPHVWLEAARSAAAPLAILASGDDAIRLARGLLREGRILAVKGLGGFHLACDATNAAAVLELRRRKLRVDKPFAVMVSNTVVASEQCEVSKGELALLDSFARPIVLLRRRTEASIALEAAPGQDWLGVMLPYTPLHHLLLESQDGLPIALVMTSGNLSEEPIAVANDEAREKLASLADFFLMHDRDIHVRCDDSVVRLAPEAGGAPAGSSPGGIGSPAYPLRRSRGYVPYPVRLPGRSDPVLAVGAELKNTFCLTNRDYGFMSHHIGDLENYETLQSFESGILHFEQLFRATPRAVAHDLHPDYLTTRYATRRAASQGIPAIGVQHHHAHIAACMAEHMLPDGASVIGVAFDGTGFGTDGAVWGGEILVADYLGFERAMHLSYFPLPGGDAAIKHPARVALALLWSHGLQWEGELAPIGVFGPGELDTLRQQLERRVNTPQTSSMGRLFDAASSLAGVRQRVNYEGQAAIEFEALADPAENGAYPFDVADSEICVGAALHQMLGDIRQRVPTTTISARFHNGIAAAVAESVDLIRKETGLAAVVLSGGVWQNITLLRRTLSLLVARDFQVYIHHEVPANDGGLSLGQAAIAASRMRASDVPGSTWSDH